MLKGLPIGRILSAAKSGGGDVAEIFAEHTITAAIAHENKKIERAVTGIDSGYGIRVITGDRTAYGYTNDPSELMNVAMSLAGKTGKDEKTNERAGTHFKELLKKCERKDIEAVCSAAGTAWNKSPFIKQVQVSWRSTLRRFWIVNSEGLSIEDEQKDLVMVVMVIAEKDGITQTGYEPAFMKLEPEHMAEVAAERALKMLDAKHAPMGLMPVVISSSAGGTMVHEAVGHGLEADLSGRGMSVYKDKLGKQVASTLITVADDATMEGHRGSFRYDDEGNPAQKNILIENGILKSYLQDNITAKRMGTKPTGNARRESYRNRPLVRMTNTMILPGRDDPEKIIGSVQKGLLVKKMGGGQVNTVNGDFVFEAQEAYLIENGRQGEPVRGATLTGNGPKVLMEIDMVGSDIGYGIGTCGKEGQGVPVGHGMPTVRIPEMTVGGH